jgi:hypothetical protein
MPNVVLDAAGRLRSPATTPGFHAGRPPRNKGRCYPADPPNVQEIVAVMRAAGDSRHGQRLRGLIIVLWRAGLRIHEALALSESDLDSRRGSLLVRRGKGGRRREVGMDDWAWKQLRPWLELRVALPVGRLFCVISGPTCGRAWSASAARRIARYGSRGWRASALRAAPAAPRACRRDGSRGRPAARHPTPARTYQPRHHLDLSAGHRQRRDHRHRPRPPPTHGRRRQLTVTVAAAARSSIRDSDTACCAAYLDRAVGAGSSLSGRRAGSRSTPRASWRRATRQSRSATALRSRPCR